MAILAAVGIAAAVDALFPALLGVVGAAGIAAGVVQVFEDDPVRVAGGVALTAVAGAVALGAILAGPPPVVAAVVAIGFGAVAAPLRAVGGGRLSAAVGVIAYGLVPLGVVAIAGIVLSPLDLIGVGVAVDAVTGGGRLLALPGLAALVLVALMAVRAAIRQLPVAELTPRDERAATRAHLADVDAGLTAGLKASGVGVVAGFVLTVGLEQYAPTVLDALVPVFTSPVLRVPVAVVAAVAVLVLVGTGLVRWAGGTLLAHPRRTAAMAAGTVHLVVVVVASGPLLDAVRDAMTAGQARVVEDFVSSFGPGVTAVLLTVAAVLVVVGGLLLVPAAVGLRIAPERALAPALSAAGLVGAAAVVAGDAPLLEGDGAGAPVVFAGIVAALVVWDLGEYAVGVAEEVEDATARRTELVHAAGSLGVALVVFVGAVGVDALVRDAATGVSQPAALAGIAAAAAGVVLLLVVLRG